MEGFHFMGIATLGALRGEKMSFAIARIEIPWLSAIPTIP